MSISVHVLPSPMISGFSLLAISALELGPVLQPEYTHCSYHSVRGMQTDPFSLTLDFVQTNALLIAFVSNVFQFLRQE